MDFGRGRFLNRIKGSALSAQVTRAVMAIAAKGYRLFMFIAMVFLFFNFIFKCKKQDKTNC